MMMSDYPAELKYTKDHEWAKVSGSGSGKSEATIGITKFAVEQLGDITLVSFDAKVGDPVTAGKAFGTIESVKTLSDLYAPFSGKVLKINAELDAHPELVNEDCYGKAWMVVIELADAKEAGTLLDSAAYVEHVKASG
jgi:glycine cleavage system H protein